MIFIKNGKDEASAQAVYMLGEDMESMIRSQIVSGLRDHGYITGESKDIAKDLQFIRNKRLLIERSVQQIWALLVRGILIGLGALIMLGLKEYLS